MLTIFAGYASIVAILPEADVAQVKDAGHQGQNNHLSVLIQPYHLHGSLYRCATCGCLEHLTPVPQQSVNAAVPTFVCYNLTLHILVPLMLIPE